MTRIVWKTIILLTLAVHASCQLIDFFQSFNAFLQPYQNKQNGGRKQPTNRRIEDFYFQNEPQNSKIIDPFGFYTTTTTKPKKLKPKTTTKTRFESSTETPKKKNNLISPNIHFLDNRNINNGNNNNRRTDNDNRRVVNNNNEYNSYNNNNRRPDNDNRRVVNNEYNSYNNNRRTDNDNRGVVNNNNDYNNNNYNRKTTSRPINVGNNYDSYNRYTTQNPLLNRPGVRPAVVDENRPPITNRPVTKPIIHFPTDSPRQQTTKPSIPVTNGPFQGESPDFSEPEPEIEVGPDEDDMSEAEKRRYLQIAEQKCDEYKSMSVKKVVALPLAPSGHGVEVNVSTCAPTNVPLIIGGKVVSINEFPHMSLVGWKKVKKTGYSWKCGGSLISEQYVLTAGHCTYQDKDYNVVSGPPHAVQLGSSYLDDRAAQVIRVAAVIRHAKYKLRRSYYDVALIRLATVVSFSEVISPACLGVPPPEGEPVIATGWGKTEFGGESSYELRSVSIPIWNMDDCRDIWGTSRKLPNGPSPDNQLCAGEKQGGKDTCQGDSGGPAQVQDGCVWRVVAVTSVGRSCGAPDTPALYARVPRAFIASQAFRHVKINNRQNAANNTNNFNNNQNNRYNNGYNSNNNGYSESNNQYNSNNNGYSGNNNPNVNNIYNTGAVIDRNIFSVNSNPNNGYNDNNNRYSVNNNSNNNRNQNANNGVDRNVNVNRNQNNYNNDNIYSTTNLNNNQQNTNNRNQNTYNNNNRNGNNVITPSVQTYYNNQYSTSTPNNYNNNWSNNNNYNNANANDYSSNNNGYNSYTTPGYNGYNSNNNYDSIINGYNDNNRRTTEVTLSNNGFPIVANRPWWNR